MFSICKQSHPATGIEFSISCHFFNNHEENIVTAGANILKVFRIIPDVDPNSTEKFTGMFGLMTLWGEGICLLFACKMDILKFL